MKATFASICPICSKQIRRHAEIAKHPNKGVGRWCHKHCSEQFTSNRVEVVREIIIHDPVQLPLFK
jgi:hypothetical protein